MSFRSLEYEENELLDTFTHSFLLISSRGLGTERLFCRHLELYSDARVLALVLGCDAGRHRLFSDWLLRRGLREPKRLTSDVAAGDRVNVYREGGVQFVTTNILVNDVMAGRVPLEHVTCVLVYGADAVFNSALDAFLLGQIRRANPGCLVKAFSDQPFAFAKGFGSLQRAVSLLQVESVRFQPRFHVSVIKSLEGAPAVEEFEVRMSSAFATAQSLLRDLLTACVQELAQCSKGQLPGELVQIQVATSPWFNKRIRRYLDADPEDVLSPKALQLIADISRFRYLIGCLESRGGVAFTTALKSLFTSRETFYSNSGWLFTDSAQSLFKISAKILDEFPGKLEALFTILNEVYRQTEDCRHTMIFVQSDIVAEDVKEKLQTIWWKEDEESDRRPIIDAIPKLPFETDDQRSTIIVMSSTQRTSVLAILYSMHPYCAIIYSADLWLLRQLEVYSVSDVERTVPLRVCFLMYSNSMEEEKYLNSVSQERAQFEELFKEEIALVITKPSDGRATVEDDSEGDNEKAVVVVDMREFRCDVPTNLHLRGFHVFPATLSIGDYVLSPSVCVERKAVNDLIGSLMHGRLYSQCEAMCANYKQPMLLIHLDSYQRSWRRLGDRMLLPRLVCLTMKFRQLNIVWAVSSLTIADLFIEFKWRRAQPDPEQAIALGKPTDSDDEEDKGENCWTKGSSLLRCLAGLGERREAIFRQRPGLTLRQLFLMDKQALLRLTSSDLISNDLYALFNAKRLREAPPEKRHKL